jgi:putative flippase GtrA
LSASVSLAPSPASIALRYVAFALVATLVNLGSQWGWLALHDGPFRLPAAMAVGTLAGLVTKYLLDKRWIFDDRSTGAGTHARKFSLYTVMGLVTTAIFWGTELLFGAVLGEDWVLAGGALGLAIGYALKYRLDRRFVFKEAM